MSRIRKSVSYRNFLLLASWLLLGLAPAAASQSRATVAIVKLGDSTTAIRATEALTRNLKRAVELDVFDNDVVDVAARGNGYKGSLNLSLDEAQNLGSAIGSTFYIIGVARTSRQLPFAGPAYFESVASLFLVSTRSGRLVKWERLSFQSATSEAAEKLLLEALWSVSFRSHMSDLIHDTQNSERKERAELPDTDLILIDTSADDASRHNGDLRLPRPYRRLRPPYPQMAAREEIEAVVDVVVDLDGKGEVMHAEIARWAGYGIDEAALETVRQLHFFPAMMNGTPVPIRVLLRYNFRKPPA
jgi:TonB family protein